MVIIPVLFFFLFFAISGDATVVSLSDQLASDDFLAKSSALRARYANSACWRDVISRVESHCDRLDDEEKNFLGLKLLNCYLSSVGRRVYRCEEGQSFRQCIDPLWFKSFPYAMHSQYVMQVHDLCVLSRSMRWQNETAELIYTVIDASLHVSEQLHTLQVMGADIEKTLEVSAILAAEQSRHARETLDAVQTAAHELEFKQQAITQAIRLFGTYAERSSAIMTAMMGRSIGWLDSLLYVTTGLAIILVGWVGGWASGLRYALVLVVCATFFTERYLAGFLHHYLVADKRTGELGIPLPMWLGRRAPARLTGVFTFGIDGDKIFTTTDFSSLEDGIERIKVSYQWLIRCGGCLILAAVLILTVVRRSSGTILLSSEIIPLVTDLGDDELYQKISFIVGKQLQKYRGADNEEAYDPPGTPITSPLSAPPPTRTLDDWMNLDYKTLRSLASKNGLRAAGRKVELAHRLFEFHT